MDERTTDILSHMRQGTALHVALGDRERPDTAVEAFLLRDQSLKFHNAGGLITVSEWRTGLSGRTVAWTAEKLAATFNALLGRVYKKAGMRVADVFAAFQTSDFDDHGKTLPRNVTLLCRWTWECAAPPRGPNQHANQAGYQVIARQFLQAAGLS